MLMGTPESKTFTDQGALMDESPLVSFCALGVPDDAASGWWHGTSVTITERHHRSSVCGTRLGGGASGDWTVTLKKLVEIKDYSSTKLELIGQHEVVSPQTGVTAHGLQCNPPAMLRLAVEGFLLKRDRLYPPRAGPVGDPRSPPRRGSPLFPAVLRPGSARLPGLRPDTALQRYVVFGGTPPLAGCITFEAQILGDRAPSENFPMGPPGVSTRGKAPARSAPSSRVRPALLA
ncbi:hypothetical protein GCM10022252_06180 [Streptosporangium oxazolinicum]|uniref:Uncharacterized protein n=1 Tax=Streptosporangium oxazolinicum TaxID=909287 RepID=A0ABP8ACE5_9ACTN